MSEKDENIVNEEVTEEVSEDSSAKKNQKRWYIVHTYSGYENKVKSNLEKRIEYMNMADKIFRVEVPQKTVTQIKGGKKQEKEEKTFRFIFFRFFRIYIIVFLTFITTNHNYFFIHFYHSLILIYTNP